MKINFGKLITAIGGKAGPLVKTAGATLATAAITALAEAAIGAVTKPRAPAERER